MKLAITGATGLLGANLAAELLAQGHSVRATRRPTSRVQHLAALPIEWVMADLSDEDSLTQAFEGAEAVFHCAAAVSILARPTPELIDSNVGGTERVIEAVRRAGAGRLVHCSSTVAVGVSTDGEPVDETAPWNFADFGLDDGYCVTKRQAEEAVMRAVTEGLDAVVVNPAFMFGPYDVKPSSGAMIMEVVRGQVPGASSGRNNFVHVGDVARGMVLALERGRAGERYILGNQNMSYQQIFGLIAERAGVAPPRFVVPHALARVGGWFGDLQQAVTGREAKLNSNTIRWGYTHGYVVSSEKAKRELGYAPRPVAEGIDEALAWFRQQGLLAETP